MPLFADLGIKIRAGRFIRPLESITVVRQISAYAHQLDDIASPELVRCVKIMINSVRDEEAVLQMLAFFSMGSFQTLTAQGSDLLRSQLCDRVESCDLSLAPGFPALEAAIVIEIGTCDKVDANVFLDFARFCYREGSDHATKDCTLGILIKDMILINLPGSLARST
ncbi:hypothetical protein DOTSEDRAFT_22396 [Dothistroma septosporum NZE10]|uniref:Uncharacterized protein n=1 Tax=Dothistroma septosporum (strain NZE10 / CBS 128990) TaxID=675120 RepID=N1PTM4_DOTSN|nr:hypothetical protein DOTSEDRAFT_22396 [Dothistroma septosporum NZE10]